MGWSEGRMEVLQFLFRTREILTSGVPDTLCEIKSQNKKQIIAPTAHASKFDDDFLIRRQG